MSATYNASEVFQFAITMEENGEKFYRELAKHSSDNEIKKFFDLIANEEVKHGKQFSKILSTFESYDPADAYPEEYFLYLKALVDNIIFDKTNIEQEKTKIKSVNESVKLAIRNEWESILYYQEIKNLVSKDQQHLIEEIIDQERNHFLKLTEFLQDIKN